MSDENGTGSGSSDSGKGEKSDELNSLLEDWDSQKGKPQETAKNGSDEGKVSSLGDIAYLSDKAISRVKGDLDVSEDFVRQYLIGLANDNDNFNKAWDEQLVNRDQWDAEISKVAENFQKVMGKKPPDDDLKPDPDKGLAAAVHAARDGQGTGTELDNLSWQTMSDSEFEQRKQEVFRLAKAGKLK